MTQPIGAAWEDILASPNRGRGLNAGRDHELQRHGDMLLDHTVMLRRPDGRVIAANAALVEHFYEIRLGGYGAVVGAKTLHDVRVTFGVDVGQKNRRRASGVGLRLQEIRPSQTRVFVDDNHQVLSTAGKCRVLSRQVHERMRQRPRGFA